MRKHKRIFIIFVIIAFVIISCTLGANLLYRTNTRELPTSTEISKVDAEEPTIEPTVEPTINPTINPTIEPTIKPTSTGNSGSNDNIDTAANDDQWKKAYIDYVTLNKDSWDAYELIHLDDDEVPELVAIGSCEAQGNLVCNYYNGTVYSTQLSRLGFDYIARQNLLCNSEGLMDHYYDIVYSLIDGKLTQIAAGYWGELDDTGHHFDKDGELIYQYSWDGVSVTKEEYNQHLNTIFDMSKATDGYGNQVYSIDEIINRIQNY